jgi:hypothetical protein
VRVRDIKSETDRITDKMTTKSKRAERERDRDMNLERIRKGQPVADGGSRGVVLGK